jgi:hypothetical protein
MFEVEKLQVSTSSSQRRDWGAGRRVSLGLHFSCTNGFRINDSGSGQFLLDVAKSLSFSAELIAKLECTADARLI